MINAESILHNPEALLRMDTELEPPCILQVGGGKKVIDISACHTYLSPDILELDLLVHLIVRETHSWAEQIPTKWSRLRSLPLGRCTPTQVGQWITLSRYEIDTSERSRAGQD